MIEQIVDRLELLIEENIKSCGEENSLMCHDRNFGVLQAIECIKKMDEQPKADWIPCEVDQPKEYGQYLYTDKNDEVHEGCYCPQYHGMISGWSTCEATGFKHLSDYEVTAWQPLPPAYKGE